MNSSTISVLIPSRGRSGTLTKQIDRLLNLAEDPDNVEVLCRLDFDDQYTLDSCARLAKRLFLKVVVGDRLSGWQSNHCFYNDLARLSTGGWLMLFNDDAEMLTGHWDVKIRQARKPILSTRMRTARDQPPFRWRTKDDRWFSNCFPVIRRDAYERLGVFSRHRHSDVYWEWISNSTGLQEAVEIDILHTPTASIRPNSERGGGWWDDFHAPPLEAQLAADRESLLELI